MKYAAYVLICVVLVRLVLAACGVWFPADREWLVLAACLFLGVIAAIEEMQ